MDQRHAIFLKEAGTFIPHDRLLTDPELFCHLCRRIDTLKSQGYYDGAYECVRLAAKGYAD